jgi:DNA-binding transcriptional regulator YdaS (Cro superfamily)
MDALRNWRLGLPNPTLEAAAAMLGISGAQMSRYEHGLRQIPARRAAEFETITGIPRAVLRPDIFGSQPKNAKTPQSVA